MKRHSFRLYRHYVALNIRSSMQYKSSFMFTILGQTIATVSTLLSLIFIFQRFPVIKGFTLNDVILCAGIVQLQFSIAEMWARGFDRFAVTVRRAEFDRILLRPRNHVLQVLGSQFELSRIGRLIQGIIMIVYGVIKAQVSWTFLKALTLFNMIVCGTLLFSGLHMIRAGLCFFTLQGLEFMNIFTDGFREHGKYPLSIYGDKFLLICTIVIPYALTQYYPLLYLLGKRTDWWLSFSPLPSLLFLIPCWLIWRVGVRHYQSAGS